MKTEAKYQVDDLLNAGSIKKYIKCISEFSPKQSEARN